MVYYELVDTRVLILTLPSLVVLGLLIVHSIRTMPRARAVAFWCSVMAYGVVRGVALKWVVDHGVGGSFPYAIRSPLLPIFGVPFQEIAGWAIVSYIGWWLGSRFSPNLFVQIAWACIFLGAISWAVESASIAAGWWHWTVPVTQPFLLNVPSIAIVDWLFVGIDFLMPFAILTAPKLRGRASRWFALLAFPLHFGAHCFADKSIGMIPIPMHHVVHWVLAATVLWLAMRSVTQDAPFAGEARERRVSWLPLAGLAIVLVDVAAVEVFMVHEPRLLVSILPALAVTALSVFPAAGYAVGGLGLWIRRHRTWAPFAVLAVVGLIAVQMHSAEAHKQEELLRRLSSAVSARDRGDLDTAERELAALCADFPGSHVPAALLGQIEYRTERLDQASLRYKSAVAIKQDFVEGFRYLAVIELRMGRNDSAGRYARKGLEIDTDDAELLYLAARARGLHDIGDRFERLDPEKAFALASLAFEVGDAAGASAMLDRGLVLWPERRAFYPARVKLALQNGDETAARRIVAAWRERFPQDADARQLSKRLGAE